MSNNDKKLIFLTFDECSNVIANAHKDCQHGGKFKTVAEIKKTKYHVADQLVMLYLRLCLCPCKATLEKKKRTKNNVMCEARQKCHVEIVTIHKNHRFNIKSMIN